MSDGLNWTAFNDLPIVGILRGFTNEQADHIVAATLEGGICNLEATMNTPGACEQISRLRKAVGSKGNVGAGTVCSHEDLERALDAGAQFIVTPVLLRDVIEICVAKKVPVFPGTLTPTEIFHAWQWGATMAKVFPADHFGPSFIKNVKAPLSHVKIMPTGGVTVESLPAFLQAGADAVGVGGPLFDKKRVENRDWAWITQQSQRFVAAYRNTVTK